MKPKRGDVREDGWRFWRVYNGKEMWVSQQMFDFKEKVAETNRRCKCREAFSKKEASSSASWICDASRPDEIFQAIANLQPEPGQTLTELIHELSGYAMEVCEQIANPPVIEDPQPAQPTPQPDLF